MRDTFVQIAKKDRVYKIPEKHSLYLFGKAYQNLGAVRLSANMNAVDTCVLRLVQDFLEEAPMSWDALVKKTFRKKEEILPMQMAEVSEPTFG